MFVNCNAIAKTRLYTLLRNKTKLIAASTTQKSLKTISNDKSSKVEEPTAKSNIILSNILPQKYHLKNWDNYNIKMQTALRCFYGYSII